MAVHEEERRGVLDLFADFGEENENKVSGEDEMSDNDSDFDIEHADIALDVCCLLFRNWRPF